jgi:hypothetical protein
MLISDGNIQMGKEPGRAAQAEAGQNTKAQMQVNAERCKAERVRLVRSGTGPKEAI